MTATRSITLLASTSLILISCRGDETVTAYGAAGIEWTLQEIDGSPFNADASLHFPEPGKIIGQAPCNRFSATMDAPYPWFELQDLSLTRMTCANQGAETMFLNALQDMTLSEVSGQIMILSNTDGHEMLFKAAD